MNENQPLNTNPNSSPYPPNHFVPPVNPNTPPAPNPGQAYQTPPPVPPGPSNTPYQGNPPVQPPPTGYDYPQYAYQRKSKLAAALLAFTVGLFGVHNFYLGFTTKGTVQLILSCVGILSNIFTLFLPLLITIIWSFVEGIQIITNREIYHYDANGVQLKD